LRSQNIGNQSTYGNEEINNKPWNNSLIYVRIMIIYKSW